MALLITDGSPLTDSAVAGGVTQVIAAGGFGGNTVEITVSEGVHNEAPVHTFFGPGAISLTTAANTQITATIIGGNASTIDVSVSP